MLDEQTVDPVADEKLTAARNRLTRYPWFKITQDEANAVLAAMAAAGMLK